MENNQPRRSAPKDILVIVVNFNQQIEIENFLNSLKPYWPTVDTVVVDDGSTDNSAELAEKLQYRVARHQTNMGVGAAIRTGINIAINENYSAVVIMSSNGKMQPPELERFTTPIRVGAADYVTGTRFVEGGKSPGLPTFRKLAIPVVSIFLGIFLRRRFTDITCGFRAYKLAFLRDPKLNLDQVWLNHYEMEYYIHYWACRLNLKMTEVPVHIRYDHLRADRRSKIPPFLGWWSMLRPIILLSLGLKR